MTIKFNIVIILFQAEGGLGDRERGQPNEEPKCKKRKRKERLRDGLKGMLNEEHRARQMRALSRVVLGDFKQRMFMHQHKIQAIQRLITSGPPSPQVCSKFHCHLMYAKMEQSVKVGLDPNSGLSSETELY